ncbi:MAG: hypothetical protein KDJ48_16405, partial [Nitratireductor sp.]|nr:hypothetical protein [Nitratireductor sp.]
STKPGGAHQPPFIDHRHFARYECEMANGGIDAETRQAAWEHAAGAFERCADRYTHTRAMIGNFDDYELLFERALSQAAHVLDKWPCDAVIFVNFPHRCATIALFALAKARGIATALCTQSLFSNRFFIMSDWRDLGLFRSSRAGPVAAVESGTPDTPPFYMNRVSGNFSKRKKAFFRFWEFYFRLLLLPFLTRLRNGTERSTRLLDEMRNSLQLLNYRRPQKYVRAIETGDLPEQFVYFPMHMQPEMTTDVMGGHWANQVIALRWIRDFVPEHIPLIIKENPKQTGLRRSPLFWRIMTQLPNVSFVEERANSLHLIKQAMMTATITGTAGWEALRFGKPALALGNVFWRSLPGAFHIDNHPQWSDIENFRFDRNAFQRGVDEMSRFTYPGVVDLAYSVMVDDFDMETNAANVAASIAWHIFGEHSLPG